MKLKYLGTHMDKTGFAITKIDKRNNESFINAQTYFNAKTTEDIYSDVRDWWDETTDRYKEKFGEGNWEEKLDSADYNVYVFAKDKQEKFRLDELL